MRRQESRAEVNGRAAAHPNAFRSRAIVVLLNLGLIAAGWAICTTILCDLRPAPPFPRDSKEYLEYELVLDLNGDSFDGDRYADGDGWFTRRRKDISSMGEVTEDEVSNAHSIFASVGGSEREAILKHFFAFRRDRCLDNYISALHQHRPEKLDELVAWISSFKGYYAKAGRRSNFMVGDVLITCSSGAARGQIAAAVEHLPGDSAAGPSRNKVIDRLGGAPFIARRLLLDWFAAVLRREPETAVVAGENAGRWYRLAPGSFPSYLETIAAYDRSKIDELIADHEVEHRGVKVLRVAGWKPAMSEHEAQLDRFAQSQLGMTPEDLKKLKRGW